MPRTVEKSTTFIISCEMTTSFMRNQILLEIESPFFTETILIL